jgi:hypothetical protein
MQLVYLLLSRCWGRVDVAEKLLPLGSGEIILPKGSLHVPLGSFGAVPNLVCVLAVEITEVHEQV